VSSPQKTVLSVALDSKHFHSSRSGAKTIVDVYNANACVAKLVNKAYRIFDLALRMRVFIQQFADTTSERAILT
jgi:hypothetical protein